MKDYLIPKQFVDNLGVMSKEEYIQIENAKVLIVGLGGLGGNFANNLVRLGVKHLKLVDFDKFEEQNLNRQIFSNTDTIGLFKVKVIKKELQKINSECHIDISTSRIEDINLEMLIEYDYIIDAVDNPKIKIYLAELSEKLNIPLLHGACAGWYGQIGWISPGSKLIHELYGNESAGIEKDLKNPSFMPSAVSAIMTSEFLKMIQNSDEVTINELLLVDIFNNTMIKTGKNEEVGQ
jgi:molybdopterin/thiamine biosynthesis adenylyltransferase